MTTLSQLNNDLNENTPRQQDRSSRKSRADRVMTVLIYILGVTITSGAVVFALWFYWTQMTLGGNDLAHFVKAYSIAPAAIKARYKNEIINGQLTHSVAHSFYSDLEASQELTEMNELKKAAM